MQTSGSTTLGFLLADAARLLRRRFEQGCSDLDMTGAQLKIVARLTHNEGIGQAALAVLLDLEPMTLSRHVDRMEAAGLVERRPDPNDRRARQLYTTAKARELLEPMRARAAAIYEQVLAGMSAEERQALRHGLVTIIANLSTPEAMPGPGPADGQNDATRIDRQPAERNLA